MSTRVRGKEVAREPLPGDRTLRVVKFDAPEAETSRIVITIGWQSRAQLVIDTQNLALRADDLPVVIAALRKATGRKPKAAA